MAVWWVVAVSVSVAVAFSLFLAVRSLQKKCVMPPNAGTWIPFKNFIDFSKGPIPYLREKEKQFGDCFYINMFGRTMIFLLSPSAHKVFFGSGDEEISQTEVYQFTVPLFGKGVVYDAELKIRSQQLKFAANGLKRQHLHTYVKKIKAEAEDYFGKWGDSGTVDLLKAMSELTILTASNCLMGQEIRKNLFTEVSRLYHDLDKGITPLSLFNPYIPIAAHRRRDRARKEMVQLFSRVIDQRRQGLAKGEIKPEDNKDLLQILMDSTYKNGKSLTNHEIAGLFIAMLFAGQHTSSITATWLSLLLLKNHSIKERVKHEKETALHEFGELDFEAVQAMNLLHASVKETLRLYPPLIMLMRYVKTPQKYKDYDIPEGATIFSSPAVTGRMSSFWTNPEQFDPDRFLERKEDTNQFSFIGFGGGLHACMGQNFAQLQIKTIWTVLSGMYDLELVNQDLPDPDYTAMVVGPKEGTALVRYRRISS